jgi:uncharacterized protein
LKSDLTKLQARRIALHAQGFRNQNRDIKKNWSAIACTIKDLHLLQIDSVNVLVRSHYLPLFSRLGNYDRNVLDKRSLESTNRHVFECWSHEASLVPMAMHPLMRWRMNRARAGSQMYSSMIRFSKDEKAFLKKTLDHIRKTGPTTTKRDKFERIYDVPERVIPAEILSAATPSEAETFRKLISLSAQALGIATEFDLRDYFRLPIAETKTAIAECVENGDLIPVKVDGWTKPTYIHKSTKLPRKAGGTALL